MLTGTMFMSASWPRARTNKNGLDYEQVCLRDPDWQPQYAATGNGIAIMANRISYAFDFHGPSMTIDTGCSGSLVSVHLAAQNLRNGDCSLVSPPSYFARIGENPVSRTVGSNLFALGPCRGCRDDHDAQYHHAHDRSQLSESGRQMLYI